MIASIASKATQAAVESIANALANKADSGSVSTALATKASVASVESLASTVAGKADSAAVTTALAGKASQTSVDAIGTTVSVKADTATVNTSLAGKAPLDSAALTGTPTAPTPTTNDDSTRIATTAHVNSRVAALINGAPAALDTLKEISDQLANDESAVAALTGQVAAKASVAALASLQSAFDGVAAAVLRKLSVGTVVNGKYPIGVPSDLVGGTETFVVGTDTLLTASGSTIGVATPQKFAVGDVVEFHTGEKVRVNAVNTNTGNLTVTRGYEGTSSTSPDDDSTLTIRRIFNVGPALDFSGVRILNLSGLETTAVNFVGGHRLSITNGKLTFDGLTVVGAEKIAHKQYDITDEYGGDSVIGSIKSRGGTLAVTDASGSLSGMQVGFLQLNQDSEAVTMVAGNSNGVEFRNIYSQLMPIRGSKFLFENQAGFVLDPDNADRLSVVRAESDPPREIWGGPPIVYAPYGMPPPDSFPSGTVCFGLNDAQSGVALYVRHDVLGSPEWQLIGPYVNPDS